MRFAARTFVPIFFRASARKLCLFFILFFLLITPAFAQTVQPVNLHNYTQNVMIEVMSSMTCLIAGVDPINPSQKCLGIEDGKIGPVETKGGAIGAMGNLIAMTFTPPAHTGQYVNYLAGNFGLSKPAFAQTKDDSGIGFQGIFPLLALWTAFRNISYLLFTLIFLVIGFAIMLRVHIDPRTVMTIENQIPKLIIALILVTFSFAVAGFMIDLMYVFIYLVIGIFDTIKDIPKFDGNIWGYNPLEVANNLRVAGTNGGITGIATKTSEAVKDISITLFSGLSNVPLIGAAFGFLVGLLMFIIIAIALLFALFRLWFTLLQSYIFIILEVVFAPFWIVAGLLPGSSINFTAWLRSLASDLLVFPTTIGMFLLANIFINSGGIGNKQELFHPPLIGNPTGSAFPSLIGLGIILITPAIAGMIKSALKVPKVDMSAIGQAGGVGVGYPISVGRNVAQTFARSREYEITKLKDGQPFYGRRRLGESIFRGLIGR